MPLPISIIHDLIFANVQQDEILNDTFTCSFTIITHLEHLELECMALFRCLPLRATDMCVCVRSCGCVAVSVQHV